jgi:hypothetical protein
MSDQSRKPSKPELPYKEDFARPEWAIPTLADLLQRLSVNSAKPSVKV